MKKLLLFLSMLFLLNVLQGQVLRKSLEIYSLTQDTLTDAGTLTFGSGYLIPSLYDLSWQIEIDSLSGTPAGTIYLEGSNCSDCSDWSSYATYTITATSAQDTTFVAERFPFYRARVRVAGSGTQSQLVRNHI